MKTPFSRTGRDGTPCRMLANPAILSVSPYVPGRPISEVRQELGLTDVVKLASNENPAGPSPRALEAIRSLLSDLHLYPETGVELRQAISERNQLPVDSIFLGHGATDLLDIIARTFLCPGDEVISAHPGFPWYQMLGQLNGAENVVVPLRDHVHDLEAMSERFTERVKLVFVANPNNPTGTMVTTAALDALVDRLTDQAILVIDEAYIEYADQAPNSLKYLANNNVIVVRTFSKIAGLAGLRIGYAMARPEIVELLDKVRPPFSTTTLAHAAALASLADEDHREASREVARAGKEFLYAELSRMGLRFVRSQANFVFVDFETSVAPIADGLLRRGFVIRPMLGTCARITVGNVAQTAGFVRALQTVLSIGERALAQVKPIQTALSR